MDKEPPEGQFIGRGRNMVYVNDEYENAIADLRAEVKALIKEHVPARARRRPSRPSQHATP